MSVLTVQLLRCLGWMVLAGSVGVVAVVALVEAAHGPEGGQAVWPTARLWRYYVNTLWMAGSATAFALILALPAAFALVQARRPWQRRILHSLTIIPLITMPSIFAYAWLLLSTSRVTAIACLCRFMGWNTPGWEPLQAAWVLASWLWPVPALILASAFKHGGARSYRLASLDAPPVTAFLRGALPALRIPFVTAAAIVFILAAIDATIPPLVFANETWASESIAAASVAGGYDHPVAFLAWYTWPMLATLGLLAAVAVPGVRRMARWVDDPETGDTGTRTPAAAWAWPLACLTAATITVFPIVVFTIELVTGGRDPMQAVVTVWQTSGDAMLATLLVALLAAAASTAMAVALLDEPNWPRAGRVARAVGVVLAVGVAVLPAPLTGTVLATFFSSETISPRDAWNVYDNSPLVWTAAMVARFGFLSVCIVRLLSRRLGDDIAAQARTDGAGRVQRIAYVRLPMLWRPLLAAAMMVACLTISEAAAAVLVRPPQFFGGSLAVHVDDQMHYGRQDETIALSLLLMIPAVLVSVVVPLLVRLPSPRRRRIRGARDTT